MRAGRNLAAPVAALLVATTSAQAAAGEAPGATPTARGPAASPPAERTPAGTPGEGPSEGPSIESLDLQSLLDTPIAAVSRREERSTQAPAAVFVVTREDMERQGFRTVAEVLRSVPGLFYTDDSLYPQVGVRGVQLLGDVSTRILVLVDGHPLSGSLQMGQSNIERDLPVSVVALERVEVIKGPVGSVYGPNAYFGVVNLVTRGGDALAIDTVLSGDVEGGGLTGREFSGWAGTRLGEVALTLNVDVYRSSGLDYALPELVGQDRPSPEGGAVPGTDARLGQNVYGTARFRDFTLSAGWGQRFKGLPTAPYSTVVGDPRNQFRNRVGFAQLSWQKQLSDELQLYARLAYDEVRYEDDLAYPEPPEDAGMFHDLGQERWISAELRATVTPFPNHRDTVGAEVRSIGALMHSRYVGLPSLVEDPENGFGLGPIPKDFLTVNAYAMVEQTLFERLTLQGGLTFYAHPLFGSRLTPKLAGVFQASPDDTVKAIYAQGFRPPTLYEAYFEDGLDFIANPSLAAERVDSLELSYERRFGDWAQVGASAYRNHYLGLISARTVPAPDLDHEPDPNEPTDFRSQFANGGELITQGLDLHVIVRHRHWVSGYGGVSLQAPRFLGGATARAGFAPLTANLAVSTRALWEPLSLALNASFVSAREKLPELVGPDEAPRVPPYLLLNLSARLDVPGVKGLVGQLTVYNLLDAGYFDPVPNDHAPLSQLRQPGRGARLSVEYRY